METQWKKKRDAAKDASEAESIVTEALRNGGRAELIQFLGELFTEFVAPDPVGGEAGTLEAMRRVYDFLQPTDDELALVGVNPKHLSAYLHHDDSATQALQQAIA
jgi:hypothetical protein